MSGTSPPLAIADDSELGDGDVHGDRVESPRAMDCKHMKMESEQPRQSPVLSATAGAEEPDPSMEPLSVLSRGRRTPPYRPEEDDIWNQNDDYSSELDDEDYAQFSQRRHQAERALMRELKTLKREEQMVQNIRSLRRERDALLEKERTWERERLALENEIKKLRQVVDPPGNGDGCSGNKVVAPALAEAVQAPSSPKPAAAGTRADEEGRTRPAQHAAARLNHVEWSAFKALPQNPEGESFAIDVLKGEPVVKFDLWPGKAKHGPNRATEARKVANAETNASQQKKQVSVLPERIRIRSRSIIKILEKISGDMLSESGEPIVVIRPFRFLVYHEENIRQELSKLEARFGDNDTTIRGAILGQVAADAQIRDGSAEDKEGDEITGSAIAYEQLRCLADFMDHVQLKTRSLSGTEDSGQAPAVFFADLWYLFKPGDDIVDQNCRQVYRVVGVTSASHKMTSPWTRYYKPETGPDEQPFTLHCLHVDFDGTRLGPVIQSFEIRPFDGVRFVTSLAMYPLRHARGAYRESFIERGRMFVESAGIRYMYYRGLAVDTRESVDSDVVVDFEGAFATRSHSSEWRPKVEDNIGQPQQPKPADGECMASCCHKETICKDDDIDAKRSRDYISRLTPEDRSRPPSVAIYPRLLQDAQSQNGALTDDELVIMSYRAFGFIMRSRKWAQLDITYLRCISWGGHLESSGASSAEEEIGTREIQTAFDQLVLPTGHKKMVISLIAEHYRDNTPRFDDERFDIIRGKGKGLIILLHGPPGVGKTATAEGAAEYFNKPLLRITCGDLGANASEVEVALETNFAMASRWGCIVLLDEADVFLTARSARDFRHNGLVAVFLRVLEYFTGILFLTTNHIGRFDEAFTSRIHLSLRYPQLDLESTLEIFKLNLRMIRDRCQAKDCEITIDEDGILLFAQAYWTNNEMARWNGRQIRNGCQTALALAEFDAQGGSHRHVRHAGARIRLQAKHIKTVSRTHLSFATDLTEVYGNAENHAKTHSFRTDNWNDRVDAKSLLPHI